VITWPGLRFEGDVDQGGSWAEQDDVGRLVSLGQQEGDAVHRPPQQLGLGIDDHLRIGDASERLQKVLGQPKRLVGPDTEDRHGGCQIR
jgi:hypothetical protein